MFDSITIQFQDTTGNWLTAQQGVQPQQQVVLARMKDVQRAHPKKRVRAVTSSGRLVDML